MYVWYRDEGGYELKRMQLIPLIILVCCGGISLSSGLYFYEIKGTIYLIPIGLMTGLFYTMLFLFRELKWKNTVSFGITLGASLLSMRLFRSAVVPGLCMLFNEISDRLYLVYGLNIGVMIVEGDGSAALAVCQLIAIVTAVSLYLYETKKPAVVTALPSFLLFIVSICADGVPYELCFIVYSGALIVFLGMGRHEGTFHKFLLLTACTCAVAVLANTFVIRRELPAKLEEYREQMSEGIPFQSTKTSEDDKKKQRINFGQFNREGNITYTGTVELYVTSHEDFRNEQLFLQHFIGVGYSGNQWYESEDGDLYGNAFPKEQGIEIESAFDTEPYTPYSVEGDVFERMLKLKPGISSATWNSYLESALRVEPNLKERIEKEIVKGKKIKTFGDAVDVIKHYYSDEFQYTLQPGKIVDGLEEVERFLFDSKRGYCTHYASGAVMMFRTMGIPARLAQGYVIAGERLKKDVRVSVQDNNAHAWTEIYIDGRGWVQLDVTSYLWNEAGQERYYDYNRADSRRQPKHTRAPKTEEEDEKETPAARKKTGNVRRKMKKGEGEVEEEGLSGLLLGYGILIFAIGFAAVCGYGLWNRRKYLKLKKAVCSGNYGARLLVVNDGLSRFWHDMGFSWDYLDSTVRSEEIFWQTKKYYVMGTRTEMQVLQEQIRRYVRCVYESRYGKDGISERDFEMATSYLYELIDNIKKRVTRKRWKKLCKCSMIRILEEMKKKEMDVHE